MFIDRVLQALPFASRLRELPAFRFLIVGGIATVVHAAAFALFVWLGVVPQMANVLGYVSALSISFFGNSLWTFRSGLSFANLARFIVVSLTGFATNALIVHLVSVTAHLPPYWAVLGIGGITPFLTYLLSSRWAYR